MSHPDRPLPVGILENRGQFLHWLLQVLLVGLILGMTRTVIPAVASSEFGVPRGAFVLLVAFVLAFGVVKSVMNFVAGRLSEHVGRRQVLLAGWLVALPIPVMIWWAPDWNWIVAATLLLGINQGLTWSMTQTAKLDITRHQERGLTLGLNEFAGYAGVALAGLATAWLASRLGPRPALLAFGMTVVTSALLLTWLGVRETLPWARMESTSDALQPDTREVLALMTWRDPRLAAICQAGLVEKFVDTLMWVFAPLFLMQQGLDLVQASAVISLYGLVWGGSQLITGGLSDRLGRHRPNVWGMLICAGGIALMAASHQLAGWMTAAAVAGFGMALLYPNLSAAVADLSPAAWRASAIGIYRFWRDLGYAVGALVLGLAVNTSGQVVTGFWVTAGCMTASGLLLAWLGEETHPRIKSGG